MTYSEVAVAVSTLARAEKWVELRSFFSYADSDEELSNKCIVWCRFFLPQMFKNETPAFHFDLVRRLLSKGNEYIAVPRGFAKTTLAQGVMCFIAANRLRNFVVIVEKSFTEAAEVLSVVRETFTDNPRVLGVYKALSKRDDQGVEKEQAKETEGDLLINGVRFRAKGFNTAIRGLKSGPFRPDFVLVDDVEEDEHVRVEEQRRKYRENFTQGILPALDIGGQVKVIGTILHNDSLLRTLIETHGGLLLRAFELSDPQNTLLWPERWTYERLMEKKAQMELAGMGFSKFAQEYLNEPIDDERRSFKLEWMQQTFTDEDIKFRTLNRYIAIDTAESKREGADYTAVSVVDWDSENNWFIQHAKRHRINSAELVQLIFDLWLRYKPLKIGVEKRAFEDQVKPLLLIKSNETGIYPAVVELEHHGQRKEDRVCGALQGRFESKKIWFKQDATDDMSILKGELYDFPVGKNDDLADSLAYVQSLGNRPFLKQKDVPTTIAQEMLAFKKSTQKPLASRFR